MDFDYFKNYRRLLPAAEKYTYLNSAGCGPLAEPALECMTKTLQWMAQEGQVNVGVHDRLKEMLEEIRADVADFIHAQPEEIYFVRCIAEGLNDILGMFSFEPGDEVLISDQENPASILPCFVKEPVYGIHTAKYCGIGNQEELLCQATDAMNGRTRMLISSHVFHTTGACVPAKEITAEARKRGIITVWDGAQAAGNVRLDVKEIGCDFYLLSCHKWLCGPEGIAAVYIRKELIPQVRVPAGGMGIQKSLDFANNTVEFWPDAHRFEYGGRHTPMYTAFSAVIRLADEIGQDQCQERRRELHRYARQVFERELPRVRLLSPEDERLQTGIFSFRIPGIDHRELVKQAWREAQMIIQWRTVDLITKEEGIRVSFNWFNQETEIDRLAAFVKTKL